MVLMGHTYLHVKFVYVSEGMDWRQVYIYAWLENLTKMLWSIMPFSNILTMYLKKT